MTESDIPHYRIASRIALGLACLIVAGCVYRIDIQQGNLLEQDAVEQVQVGMSQSAVQFLLGTPMVADPFHANRWDYPYYHRRGRSPDVQRRWLVVFFEDGRVTRVERDLTLDPST
jgi:outer membrane protein assembly factor BamE